MSETVKHIRWDDITNEQLSPLLERRYLNGERVTLARFFLRKGCLVAQHSHSNEQVSYVVEGMLRYVFPDKEVIAHGGEVVTIPPNLLHSAEALEDTLILDVFAPVRADWAEKKDDYLRGPK
jgi:quercetin dioxygenase-like cupin family protein